MIKFNKKILEYEKWYDIPELTLRSVSFMIASTFIAFFVLIPLIHSFVAWELPKLWVMIFVRALILYIIFVLILKANFDS